LKGAGKKEVIMKEANMKEASMKETSMKKTVAFALATGIALVASLANAQTIPDKVAKHSGPVKVAVIRNLGSDDHTNQFLAGAKEEGEGLGFKVDTFITNGDDAKFQDYANLILSQSYDGLILSHGKDPYSTDLVKKFVAKGMAVSSFDTAITGTIHVVRQ
jgi:simple sugar transport system substrate-binding protein